MAAKKDPPKLPEIYQKRPKTDVTSSKDQQKDHVGKRPPHTVVTSGNKPKEK